MNSTASYNNRANSHHEMAVAITQAINSRRRVYVVGTYRTVDLGYICGRTIDGVRYADEVEFRAYISNANTDNEYVSIHARVGDIVVTTTEIHASEIYSVEVA